jgi:translation elongation factor EF-1alpha
MGLFRRKTQTIDAEHLLREAQEADLDSETPPAVPSDADWGSSRGAGASPDFRLTVQDVFVIRGRGTVVTGQVGSGSVAVGSEVSIEREDQVVRRVTVTGVEMFRKKMDTAVAGQNVGLLLDKADRDEVLPGDVLVP